MRVLLIAYLSLISIPANAQFYTGSNLNSFCTLNKVAMVGYVAGVLDSRASALSSGIKMIGQSEEGDLQLGLAYLTNEIQNGICLPQSPDLVQMVDVACKYVIENPETRHLSAVEILVAAYRKAFPCGR